MKMNKYTVVSKCQIGDEVFVIKHVNNKLSVQGPFTVSRLFACFDSHGVTAISYKLVGAGEDSYSMNEIKTKKELSEFLKS